jgi:hypothetical protein
MCSACGGPDKFYIDAQPSVSFSMPLQLLSALILLALAGVPGSLILAWWLWCRRPSQLPSIPWRKRLVFLGLVTTSCNLLLYGGYLLYWSKFMYSPGFWRVRDTCGTVGCWLLLVALTASLFGKSALRFALVFNCAMGMLLWVPIGIL